MSADIEGLYEVIYKDDQPVVMPRLVSSLRFDNGKWIPKSRQYISPRPRSFAPTVEAPFVNSRNKKSSRCSTSLRNLTLISILAACLVSAIMLVIVKSFKFNEAKYQAPTIYT